MREILFRGKRSDNGEWVEGGICDYNCGVSIFVVNHYDGGLYEPPYTDLDEIEVIPETVGQYTGLTDKNGTRIFEGDIVRAPYIDPIFQAPWDTDKAPAEIALVKFNNGQYYIDYIEGQYKFTVYSCKEYIEVIGNIHDNPELLERE